MVDKIKTVSTLELRQRLGQLTDEVIYGKNWLKVTKNGRQAILLLPWEQRFAVQKASNKEYKKKMAEDLMKRFDQIRARNSRKTKLINGMSWSEFIQRDRHMH